MIHQFVHATNCEHSTHTFRPPHLTTFNTLPAQQDYLQYHSDFSNFWPHMQALKCIPPSNTTVNKHGQHHVAGLDTATCSMSVMTTGFNTFMISGFNTQHILATAFPTATFSTLSPSPTVVVHCRDHAASAMNLCTLFIPLLDCSPKNIRRHNRIHQAQPFTYTSHQFLQQLASQPWLHKYNWGCSPTHHCPTAYILLKQKKHFWQHGPLSTTGVSFLRNCSKPQLSSSSKCSKPACPTLLGSTPFHIFFAVFQHFLSQSQWPPDVALTIHNQDLAGFFTSIPAQRIMQSVQALLRLYQQQHPHVDDNTTFSADLQQADATLRMFLGRPRRAAKVHRQKRFGDICNYCALSLHASIFTHMHQTFQQVRGSAIGNQISPVLARITVSHVEQQWITQPHAQSLPQRHSNRIYITRYVDNRLVLLEHQQQHHTAMQQFLADTFYQPPVLLEPEPDFAFLGCTINPDN